MRHLLRRTRPVVVALALPLTLSCSGGSGSGSSEFDDRGVLMSVEFLDPLNINPEPEDLPPQDAPLVQRIAFTFSGRPDPSTVGSQTLRVLDSLGFPVPGQYQVDGNVATFTPRLPTRPVTEVKPGVFDSGGAGLMPGQLYSLRAGPQTWPFLVDVALALRTAFPDPTDARGMAMAFMTTTSPQRYFKGLRKVGPGVLGVTPGDGSQVSPNLYSDPDDLFSTPVPFQFTLDAPVSPEAANLDLFRLVDLDDRTPQFPSGRPLGVQTSVLINEMSRAVVEVTPSGILPFDHMLSLEYPVNLRGLSQTPQSGPGTVVGATYAVESAAAAAIHDRLAEDFDTTDRRDFDPGEFVPGELAADWDVNDSNILQASFGFDEQGQLGRFAPLPPPSGSTRVITFDTARMQFPLFDGSTPDAPAGYTVIGGVFPFTSIDIPAGVTLKAIGINPLVLTATETVRLAGIVDLKGGVGTDDNAFDSGIISMTGGPGGSGGGRGGEGHPIVFWPPGQISLITLTDPLKGGRGYSPDNSTRTGGDGGQTGAWDSPDANGNYSTDQESTCQEFSGHNNGWKVPGGGGGSMLIRGKNPKKHGIGNVLPDGQGGYIVRDPTWGNNWDRLVRGSRGDPIFADSDPDNDFIGVLGEFQHYFGGQGGGGGASGMDSYMCGAWCLLDADPTNDFCRAEFGFPRRAADSVGDSRGGGGGGGGGCFVVKALGDITIESGAVIECSGTRGGGGEQLACSTYGGSGGGGGGGAIILQSATEIFVEAGTTLNVAGGPARVASTDGQTCTGNTSNAPGAGGAGGRGLIQLQVPLGKVANVDPGATLTGNSWVDPTNTLNPSEFGSQSLALSSWFDMGRTTARPPANTNPIFAFRGLALDGEVLTDASGNQLLPADIRCDYLGQVDPLDPTSYLPGQEPRVSYIPPTAKVFVHFQGADAVVEGSKEVDPSTITAWTANPQDLNAMQFLRYRIRFDIAVNGAPLGPTSPRPAVQSIGIDAEF